jgi:WD40 repeat protein
VHEPIAARPVGSIERARKWARRRPAIAALMLLLTLSGVLGLCGILWQWRRAERALDRSERSAYFNRVSLAHREWLANNLARADQLLDECPIATRQWEWRYLKGLTRGATLSVLARHPEAVWAVAVSPDGNKFATGSLDRMARIWDMRTGKELLTLRGHEAIVNSVAFSPDGTRLVSGSGDATAKVWDVATGEALLTLRGHSEPVQGVAFSPDGHLVASAGRDGRVRLWEASTGQSRAVLQAHRNAKVVVFSPDGKRLASGGQNERGGSIEVWDVATARHDLSLRLGTVPVAESQVASRHPFVRTVRLSLRHPVVRTVRFSSDGTRLASGDFDAIRLWDMTTGRELLTLRGNAANSVDVALSPDGRLIGAGGSDRVVRIWDVESGEVVNTFPGHEVGVTAVAFTTDGQRILSAGRDKTVRAWDLSRGDGALTLPGLNAAFSPDSARTVSWLPGVPEGPPVVKVWDSKTGHELRAYRGHVGAFGRAWISPDGTRVISYNFRETRPLVKGDKFLLSGISTVWFKLWDAATASEILTLPADLPSAGADLPLRHDGERLLSWLPDKAQEPATATVSDVRTGRPLVSLHGIQGPVARAWFSDDGRRIAGLTGSADELQFVLWSAETGGMIHRMNGPFASSAVFALSPNGRRLAVMSRETAGTRITGWNLETGREVFRQDLSIGAGDKAFSHDGERFAAVTEAGVVTVWDATEGDVRFKLRGHQGTVMAVRFAPDGHRIATAGSDGTIRLWDAETGMEVFTFQGQPPFFGDILKFSADGRRLASSHLSRSGLHFFVRIWDASPQ